MVSKTTLSADPADGKGKHVSEDNTISGGQEMMRANCKSQREGSRQKKKARSNASEQGGSKRDKGDESKPTDRSKFQEQETRKKTPGVRARKQDIRPSLPWCFGVVKGSVLEAWVVTLELVSCGFRKQR